jgi:adenosine deaminase
MRCSARFLASLSLVFAVTFDLHAQAPGGRADGQEARAARAYQEAVKAGPPALHAFLVGFPKGADLHVHLSGAVYAESFIRAAGEDGLCVDPTALSFAKPPCDLPLIPASRLNSNLSPADQELYDRLIDAFSMRSFVPTAGYSGHDQFFATFDRFGGLNKRHTGEWVDEVASRAAAQNQQYLELMHTPSFRHAAQIAHELRWNPDLAQFRQALLDHGLRDEVAVDREEARGAEELRKEIEHCGTPQAAPACGVEVRYIYQVLRGHPPEQVFAQTVLGFETVAASMEAESESGHEGGWVGINFVMPEDGFISMRDYSLQMRMLDYLHSVYPRVHISLHAGELAPGLVPPEGLRSHIREAVDVGHAERIGHGVDVMYEDDALGLLKELAQKHVMIEINLSSNEGILGIKGAEHPFANYRAARVPVALSTDDEGVSRIEITHEYVRAALDYHLSYQELKKLARTGMEYSFLPGKSLWAVEDEFALPVAPCRAGMVRSEKAVGECKSFLDGNEKAAAQWELERRFRAFEGRY